MPIYEYACRHCGHRFERLVLRTSQPPQCPSCQSPDLEQLISLSSVSSEHTRQASLGAAHKKTTAVHNAKRRDQHTRLHRHFD